MVDAEEKSTGTGFGPTTLPWAAIDAATAVFRARDPVNPTKGRLHADCVQADPGHSTRRKILHDKQITNIPCKQMT